MSTTHNPDATGLARMAVNLYTRPVRSGALAAITAAAAVPAAAVGAVIDGGAGIASVPVVIFGLICGLSVHGRVSGNIIDEDGLTVLCRIVSQIGVTAYEESIGPLNDLIGSTDRMVTRARAAASTLSAAGGKPGDLVVDAARLSWKIACRVEQAKDLVVTMRRDDVHVSDHDRAEASRDYDDLYEVLIGLYNALGELVEAAEAAVATPRRRDPVTIDGSETAALLDARTTTMALAFQADAVDELEARPRLLERP